MPLLALPTQYPARKRQGDFVSARRGGGTRSQRGGETVLASDALSSQPETKLARLLFLSSSSSRAAFCMSVVPFITRNCRASRARRARAQQKSECNKTFKVFSEPLWILKLVNEDDVRTALPHLLLLLLTFTLVVIYRYLVQSVAVDSER